MVAGAAMEVAGRGFADTTTERAAMRERADNFMMTIVVWKVGVEEQCFWLVRWTGEEGVLDGDNEKIEQGYSALYTSHRSRASRSASALFLCSAL